MRLDKFISDIKNISRKESKNDIKNYKVKVNESFVSNPEYKLSENDNITYNYENYIFSTKYEYYILNKPKDYIVTSVGKKNIMQILPDNFKKLSIMPVGRLDMDTTGALLFTNDGKLAFRLLSPKWHIPKIYKVELEFPICETDIIKLENGIHIDDFITKSSKVTVLNDSKKMILLEIVEGKFHQVKKMMNAINNSVVNLDRISFAGIKCDIGVGEMRKLNYEEINYLYKSCSMMR